MPHTCIDHLVIAAPSLEAGSIFIRETLGVDLAEGGRHLSMGTHNRLLRLGTACYLEVIAIDPRSLSVSRPRWFALDRMGTAFGPRLVGWVARTDDIEGASRAASGALGTVVPMNRGALEWRITIPEDGSLPLDGLAPMLIQWRSAAHPAALLEDRGCALAALEGTHPDPSRVRALLSSIGFQGDFSVSQAGRGEAPRLIAHLRTPGGLRLLDTMGARLG